MVMYTMSIYMVILDILTEEFSCTQPLNTYSTVVIQRSIDLLSMRSNVDARSKLIVCLLTEKPQRSPGVQR